MLKPNNKKKKTDKKDKKNILHSGEIHGSNSQKLKPERTMPTQRKIFYLILFFIPVLFFVLLEISLRVFNYGYDLTQWVHVTNDKLILNTEIARKYFFNTNNIPYSNQNAFDEVKTDSTFRVFVLGGSSAAGYPFLPIGSFSTYLQNRLELTYPHSKIEVINCSMTAINSYTIRDLFPGVLEQKPDLVLIYAGHNEYYGALGVGSMENLGTSRTLINLVITLESLKTFQLLRNLIKSGVELFSNSNSHSGTLMSRMIKDQFITYNSDTYYKGLSQFEENISDILEMANDAKVPIILGTLTCNLKDQEPFASISDNGYPHAKEIFLKGKEYLDKNNFKYADSLFRFARDLDAIKFRAPEKMNVIIQKIGKKYNAFVVNIDSAFAEISPDHIVGNNLMTDHLHPTIHGYQYMGKVFYDEMKKINVLPKSEPKNFTDKFADSLAVISFHFSKLDSVIGNYRIKLLKNDWPFIAKDKKLPDYALLQPRNHIDSVAAKFLTEDANWEKVHRELADWYLKHRDINSFLDIMDVLIAQYPIILGYYDYVANALMNFNLFDKAVIYLDKRYKIKPDAFSTKWLGIIALSKDHYNEAEKYLIECLKFTNKDPQVFYNLAGCYVSKGNYRMALDAVNKSLKLNPNYKDALNLRTQLLSVL